MSRGRSVAIAFVITALLAASACQPAGSADNDISAAIPPQSVQLADDRPWPPLSTLWLVARGDGSVARSSGLDGLIRLGTGRYEARFTRDVRVCGYQVTVGDPANHLVFAPGLAFAAGGHVSAKGVYIETKNLGGGLADFPFHLVVTCDAADWSVVDSAGQLVRGSANSVSRLGTGRYEVNFGHDISRCTFLSTIADPGTDLVYEPAMVYTAGGHVGVNGVYVETKNLGGGLTDKPFHLTVDCAGNPVTAGTHSAVIAADGTLVRANGPWTSTRIGVGRYEIRIPGTNIRRCAYTATIGHPANDLVFSPGLIFTAGGHSGPDGVYIETKNLGGGLTDAPFHVMVNCARRTTEQETLGVLHLNIEGTNSQFGPWRDRHSRLAKWMRDTQTIPELLVLQETPASKCWFLGGCDPKDYEALFLLMSRIESYTGVPYRVALFSTGGSVEGWNPLFQGRAVLYNPARLSNITPASSGGTFDDLSRVLTRRASYPCRNPRPDLSQYCARIDSAGGVAAPHWAARGVAFARFALTEQASPAAIDVYNVHAPFIPNSDVPDLELVADAVKVIEASVPRTSQTRLLPPLLFGDFNTTANYMADEVAPGSRLGKLDILAYAPPPGAPSDTDVIGALIGRPELFPSLYKATISATQFLPELAPPLCGNSEGRWSDHCAHYVEIGLVRR